MTSVPLCVFALLRFNSGNSYGLLKPLQAKLHKLKSFAFSRVDLLAMASGQAVFGAGNLVKLKGHADVGG